MSVEAPASGTFYRWRLVSGAHTAWQPAPSRVMPVPTNAEYIEFHEGKPGLPPRRRAEAKEPSPGGSAG